MQTYTPGHHEPSMYSVMTTQEMTDIHKVISTKSALQTQSDPTSPLLPSAQSEVSSAI